MELIKIELLLFYTMLRVIPFVITFFLLFNEKKKERITVFDITNKVITIVVGMALNAVVFLGMHYYHYKDFEIIGYIKNVWGLNFYYYDVEYFIFSAALGIVLSMVIGILLRIFSDEERLGYLKKSQHHMTLVSGMVSFVLVILGMQVRNYYNSNISINEVCANNDSYVLDENNLIADYVELYNSSVFPCEISELYLSDDEYSLQKMSLEGKVIPAQGVLVVPCVKDINSFAIDSKGEVVYLSDSVGNILDKVEIEEIESDSSYIRVDDKWEVGLCSPGSLDEIKGNEYQVPKPVLSHASGFYDTEFELEIACSDGTVVYYTLDGSVPDEGSHFYEDSIHVYDKSQEANIGRSMQNVVLEWKDYTPDTEPVDKAFLIRAIAVDNEGRKSDEAVATYFVDKEQYKGKTVVSLITDPDNLYNDETGMYVTGRWYDEWYLNGQEGDEPSPNFKIGFEKPAVIEFFDESQSILQQDVGIKIQGASARERIDKRFSVYARKEYSGTEWFDAILFNRETQPHSLLIKEGPADLLCQRLMENRNIPIQQGEQIYLFLNGEYWYDNRTMREKYSTQYFEDYYGIAKDNIMIFKTGHVDKGVETDQRFYDSLYKYIEEHDFADDKVYKRFCEMVDISNYIDFMCANIYCVNMDVDNIKNVLMWRSREKTDDKYSDGRWRWALYDMDAIEWTDLNYYQVEEVAAVDSFSQKPQYANCSYNQMTIYSALRENEAFCKQFVITFMDLLNDNFTSEKAGVLLDEYGEDITWLGSFFEHRPAYAKEYLAKEFELTGSLEEVVIHNENEEYGKVLLNTITPEMTEGSWSGEYYTDYAITVTAIPAEGCEFIGWNGSVESTEQTIEVNVELGGVYLNAEFQEIE